MSESQKLSTAKFWVLTSIDALNRDNEALWERSSRVNAGSLRSLPGMVHLQLFGNSGHGPVPRRPGDESEQETGTPNDR